MIRSRFSSVLAVLAIIYLLSNILILNFIYSNQKKILNLYKPVFKLTNELLNTNCHSAFDFKSSNLNILTNVKNNLECKEEDWILLMPDGTLLYNQEYLKSKNLVIDHCEYQIVKWKTNDFDYDLLSAVFISNGSKIDLNEQFFHIKCKEKNSKQVYKSVFARIFKRFSQVKLNTKKQPINIMVIGLDSVSREAWLKNLPKSSNYLLKKLKADVMEQYNIGELKNSFFLYSLLILFSL